MLLDSAEFFGGAVDQQIFSLKINVFYLYNMQFAFLKGSLNKSLRQNGDAEVGDNGGDDRLIADRFHNGRYG